MSQAVEVLGRLMMASLGVLAPESLRNERLIFRALSWKQSGSVVACLYFVAG